jgi:hypothetical protein
MRKQLLIGLLILVVAALAVGAGAPREAAAQKGGPEPAALVLSVDNGPDALLNRMDWDVNAWSPLFPAAGLRASDYIDLQGRTTVLVLCTDLQLLDQRGSEVPRCNAYPADVAFYYADDPTWEGPDDPSTVVIQSTDPATFPPEADPGAYNLIPLDGDQLARVTARANAVLSLGLSQDAAAFALSSIYRTEEMYFDAITTLTALPDVGCSARRPSVDVPDPTVRTLGGSPVVYLRLGELYQTIGLNDDAGRYYKCAADVADQLGATADSALAYARLANIAADTGTAIQLYQLSINNYAALGAKDPANAMLELCGARNCTL